MRFALKPLSKIKPFVKTMKGNVKVEDIKNYLCPIEHKNCAKGCIGMTSMNVKKRMYQLQAKINTS